MGNYPRAASTSFRCTTVDHRRRGHIDAYRNARARVWSQHVTARRDVSHSHRESETVMTGTSEPPLFKDGREPLFSIQNSSDLSFLLGNSSQLALHACNEQIALGNSPSPRQFQSTKAQTLCFALNRFTTYDL